MIHSHGETLSLSLSRKKKKKKTLLLSERLRSVGPVGFLPTVEITHQTLLVSLTRSDSGLTIHSDPAISLYIMSCNDSKAASTSLSTEL